MSVHDELDDRFAVPMGEVLTHPLDATVCVCGHPQHDGFCEVCGCSIYEPDNGRPPPGRAVHAHRTYENYTGLYGTERKFRL